MEEFEIEIEMWGQAKEQRGGGDNGDLIISGVPGNSRNVERRGCECVSTRKSPNLAAIPGSSLK